MQIIDDWIANTRLGAIPKYITSMIELKILSYYKRNPTESRALKRLAELYAEEQGPILSFVLRGANPVLFSPGELLNLCSQSRVMAGHGGAFAEVGVFRGVSSLCICESKGEAPLHLFDTFEGLPPVSDIDSRFRAGMFAADVGIVRQRLHPYANVFFHKGRFPMSANSTKRLKFSFVHLDVDLYETTKDALEFFYPRMLPGGRILSHDYGQCTGVWRAFDEFFADKPDDLEPMEATQVLVIKKGLTH